MMALGWIAIVAGLFLLALAFYGWQTWIVELKEVPIDYAFEEPAAIVQISDIHGKTAFLNGTISGLVNRLAPDIVCVTGDLTNHLHQRDRVIRELERIRCEHIFFVPGNHEWYEYTLTGKRNYSRGQYEETMRMLRDAGIRVLENESDSVRVGSGQVVVYGYDNAFYGNEKNVPLPTPAVRSRSFILALGHSPSILRFLQKNRVVYNLLLVGHTHGGQIRPFGWTVGAYKRLHTGLKKLASGRYFYISRGLGNVRIPLRLGSRPEIALFRVGGKRQGGE